MYILSLLNCCLYFIIIYKVTIVILSSFDMRLFIVDQQRKMTGHKPKRIPANQYEWLLCKTSI